MLLSTARRGLVAATAAASLAVGLLAATTATAGAAAASHGDRGLRTASFDFTDAYYRANGIDPAQLVGRRAVGDGISVADTAPDRNHRDVRSRFTLPAYDTSGKRWYFTVLADVGGTALLPNAAGRAAQALGDASPVYVFPTLTGDPTSVGNNRQADMVDLSHGYFSNNPLGIWVHVFVTWTPKASNTAAGRTALAALAARNGLALDGTPLITTQSDLDSLTKKGLVAQTRRAAGTDGRYFICPVVEDPRDGAIAPDAFLSTVRRADGSPLPAEQSFVTDFTALQTTGDYPRT